MNITPDVVIYFKYGFAKINATILMTWLVMALLGVSSWIFSRKIRQSKEISKTEMTIEIVLEYILKQLKEIGFQNPRKYFDFIASLFIFIGVCGMLTIVPGYVSPTSSLSTTAALAISVFIAVPIYAIWEKGVIGYLKNYIQPSIFLLPFNILSELTRTLALAVRLFGNAMSGSFVAGIIISVSPLLFPALFELLGLIVGLIQAYIFSVLASVYIAAATRISEKKESHG